MISKEVYEILHEIDGSPDWMTRHLNWGKVSSDDPRLVKIRKEITIEHRPAKKKVAHNHRKETFAYDDGKILELLEDGHTNNDIARMFNVSRSTMYAHIKKTPVLKENYEKNLHEFRTIIAIKNGKKCATGSLTNVSKKLGLKRSSVSYALLANQKLFGYRFMRLRDWRKTHDKA